MPDILGFLEHCGAGVKFLPACGQGWAVGPRCPRVPHLGRIVLQYHTRELLFYVVAGIIVLWTG